jgi:hypothetical protein
MKIISKDILDFPEFVGIVGGEEKVCHDMQ